MGVRFVVFACLLLAANWVSAAHPEDFAIWLERVEGSTTTVRVVGSWTTDEGVQGWVWGLCHSPEAARIGDCLGPVGPCDNDCPNVSCPPDMAAPGPRGQAADFFSLNVYERGIANVVALDFMRTWHLPARDRFEHLDITYELTSESASLDFCDHLGQSPSEVGFVINGRSIMPSTQRGLVLSLEPLFRRGDTNTDGALDIADGISILSYLFGTRDRLDCYDAADCDDNGMLNIADAIVVLSHVFGRQWPISIPVDECGTDPTKDALTCESFPVCE